MHLLRQFCLIVQDRALVHDAFNTFQLLPYSYISLILSCCCLTVHILTPLNTKFIYPYISNVTCCK